MTVTLQDLKHFELMSELENRQNDEVIIEEKKASIKPSFTEKILKLSEKLRNSGYTNQAESLENTFVIYKQAESVDPKLLYRAHDETGEDLIEFAHPDGDVEIAPAKNQYGHIETPISQHKKIIDIVQKKVAQDNSTKIKSIIIAMKFEPLRKFIQESINKYFPGVDAVSNKRLQIIEDKYKTIKNVINYFNKPNEYLLNDLLKYLYTLLLNNEPQLKPLISMDDVDDYIESTTNIIKSLLPIKQSYNKSIIVDMLKKSLNIKTSQLAFTNVILGIIAGFGIMDLMYNKDYFDLIDSIISEANDAAKGSLRGHFEDPWSDEEKIFISKLFNIKKPLVNKTEEFKKLRVEIDESSGIEEVSKFMIILTDIINLNKSIGNIVSKISEIAHSHLPSFGGFAGGNSDVIKLCNNFSAKNDKNLSELTNLSKKIMENKGYENILKEFMLLEDKYTKGIRSISEILSDPNVDSKESKSRIEWLKGTLQKLKEAQSKYLSDKVKSQTVQTIRYHITTYNNIIDDLNDFGIKSLEKIVWK